MSGPKSENAIPKTISLPDDIWEMVNHQSDEWRTSKSAAILRMILEWQNSRSSTQVIQEPESIPALAA